MTNSEVRPDQPGGDGQPVDQSINLEAIDPTSVVESSPDGVVIVDGEGVIVLVNGQTEAMFGYDRRDLIGQPIEILVPEQVRERHVGHRSRFSDDPSPRPMGTALELKGRRRNGDEFPVEISLSPITSGGCTHFIAAVRDVTKKVAAEAESLAILGTIDAAHDGVLMFDPDTLRFTYANQGAVKQLGFDRQEFLTMSATDIAPELSEQAFRSLLQPLLDGAVQSVSVTTCHRRKDGTDLPVDIVFDYPPAPRSDVDRRLVALVRDISGRRKVENERDRGLRWLQSLAALRSTLMADPPLHEVLTLACQQARQLTHSEAVAICESVSSRPPDRPGSSMRLFRFRYFDNNETESVLAARQLVADEPVERVLNGSPAVLDHRREGAPLGESNRDLTDLFDQIMVIPIEGAGVVAGLLFLGRRGSEPFTDEEISVATSLSAEAHNAYSLTDARRTKIQVKILEDRERLARDLHDLVIQRIFAAGLRLQSVQGLTSDPLITERLGDTITQLDETIAELRNAIFRLNSPSVSVTSRLKSIIDNASSHLGFRPTVHIEGDIEQLPAVVVAQLEPALSEALANVHRHAEATKVDVTLTITDETLLLTVVDDGIGFDPSRPRGSGLNNLESRAMEMGGTSSVSSTTNQGTELTWAITY